VERQPSRKWQPTAVRGAQRQLVTGIAWQPVVKASSLMPLCVIMHLMIERRSKGKTCRADCT
jgi:hypothetical protein